jgi:TolB-like protein
MPFANLSDDPQLEHFGDGLAEELLNARGRAQPSARDGAHLGLQLQGPRRYRPEIGQALGGTS